MKILANLITCLAVIIGMPILVIVAVGHLFYNLFSYKYAVDLIIIGSVVVTIISLIAFWAFRM